MLVRVANPNGTTVDKGKQDKHVEGTNNYKQELANGKINGNLKVRFTLFMKLIMD